MGEFNSDGLFLKTKTNILVRNYGWQKEEMDQFVLNANAH